MARYEYKAGEKISSWTLISGLGRGGNGEVWKATDTKSTVALKIFSVNEKGDYDRKRYKRFATEIEFLKGNSVSGILPILNSSLPDKPSRENPAWLAMPIASPIREALGENPSLEIVVEAVATIAETLTELHDRGISHRDIKPENLYQLDGHWVIGDFGLIELPDMERITKEGEKLGPLHFIAPEMIEKSGEVDGRPADVYSLAKTLWVLARGDCKFPPPGVLFASHLPMALRSYVNHPRIERLDFVLERTTKHDPNHRISMVNFMKELKNWLSPVVISDDLQDLAVLSGSANAIINRHLENIFDYGEAKRLAIGQANDLYQLIAQVITGIEKSFEKAQFAASHVFAMDTYSRDTLAGSSMYHIAKSEIFFPAMDNCLWEKIVGTGISIANFPQHFFSAAIIQLGHHNSLHISVSHFSYKYDDQLIEPHRYFSENCSHLQIGDFHTEKALINLLEEFKRQLIPSVEGFLRGLRL